MDYASIKTNEDKPLKLHFYIWILLVKRKIRYKIISYKACSS